MSASATPHAHLPTLSTSPSAFHCTQCGHPLRNIDPAMLDSAALDSSFGASFLNDIPDDAAHRTLSLANVASTQQLRGLTSTLPNSLLQNPALAPYPPASSQADSFIMLSRSSFPAHHSAYHLADSASSSQFSPSRLPPSSLAPAAATSSASASSAPSSTSLSHRLRVAQRLFDIMSARTSSDPPIDHPLCQDCAEVLRDKLDRRLAEAREEKDRYESFLAEMQAGDVTPSQKDQSQTESSEDPQQASPPETSAESRRIEEEIELLRAKERQALATLAEIAQKNEKLRAEIALLEDEERRLDEVEEGYWHDHNDLSTALATYAAERDSVAHAVEHATRELERLQRTNVYNDTFRIWHDGQFGTINGFRLGRLPTQPVDWSEINAALGQTLLLLYTLAKKLNFKFKTYKLIPNGSFSRIEKIDGEKAVYEFRIFQYRRFDGALVAFLNCLQQLGESLEKDDPNFKLPYRINKDKIGDMPVKLQFNQDEQWTKALSYILIDIKWIATLFY
ncbi:APG6-domain-containing protein [Gonapodya prolifera JEL478]|uniref:APG6-domain-containing protein n=1 Tax=Gonapodya prolifera (strain JEL478) TaxID=1344416 RepID=A0A139AAG7_GONPJ|nr:APG6-domain-containing protein [Gonapodya prolifera JEL478]|eukprot:KXS13679.1 APG6-domain-containing protein [Gonapodya prolifera JEL478]